jgi:hypothetical protein
MSVIGTKLPRTNAVACPQLAKADMGAFGRHSGFDPFLTSATNFRCDAKRVFSTTVW